MLIVISFFREKLRSIEYNNKLERISKLEEELKVNLMELKNRQNSIVSKEKELDEKSVKLKEKEERIKTIVEEEKKRSINNVHSSTKELKLEATQLKSENSALAKKIKELEISLAESKIHENQLRKTQHLINETKGKNDILAKKVADVEAKLEQSLSQQLFYKKALENSEIQNQKLIEENDRNKTHQILDQKEEIHRLRSELTLAMRKSDEKLTTIVKSAPNDLALDKHQRDYDMNTNSITSTISDTNTVISKNDITKKTEKSVVDIFKYGKHPGSEEKKFIDIQEQIAMLQKEKAMFLKTKVYSNDDPIVKQLSEKIDTLLEMKK